MLTTDLNLRRCFHQVAAAVASLRLGHCPAAATVLAATVLATAVLAIVAAVALPVVTGHLAVVTVAGKRLTTLGASLPHRRSLRRTGS